MATRRSTLTLLGAASAFAITAALTLPAFANDTLKIGFVGVTSGPAAAWGTSNVRSMETLAEMWNAAGGVKIGDKTYDIDIVTFDDQKDPKLAIQGMEKMASEGIHYVVGPNVGDQHGFRSRTLAYDFSPDISGPNSSQLSPLNRII